MGLAALAAGSTINGCLGGAGPVRGAPDPRVAQVVEVIDGDSIRVRFVSGTVRSVRYIGIDTPETPWSPRAPRGGECFWREAKDANEDLVDGRRVQLRYDAERQDRYGRLLAYVRRRPDGRFRNEHLIAEGLARPLAIRPNIRHARRFEELATRARRQRRGMWAECPVRPR